MSQELALLDEALDLARQEKAALEGGDYDHAIECAGKRSEIMGMAWNTMDMKNSEAYRARLLELSNIQDQLVDLATSARDMIRKRLNRSRQEKRRIQGYHLAVGQALQ